MEPMIRSAISRCVMADQGIPGRPGSWQDRRMDTSPPLDHIAALEREGRAFLASCEAAPRDVVIAACPEWRPADLLWHLTEVHWFWRSIVEQRAQHPSAIGELPRPDDADLPELYRIGLGALVTTLATTDPAAPVWTWAAQKDAGFVA